MRTGITFGKTRLALEVADQYNDCFPDGVWFVPLSALDSPARLVSAIAEAVYFRFQAPTDPQTQLLRYLCEKRLLLILDNAEHLLDGVGLFAEILRACLDVKLLVTSRERLNLLSECVFDIMGLPVPPGNGVEKFESYSSVALFLQSARRAFAGFMPDERDRAAVSDICRLVEGMPLAIELAASWIRTLSTVEIAAEIRQSLDFLSTSAVCLMTAYTDQASCQAANFAWLGGACEEPSKTQTTCTAGTWGTGPSGVCSDPQPAYSKYADCKAAGRTWIQRCAISSIAAWSASPPKGEAASREIRDSLAPAAVAPPHGRSACKR